MRIVVVEDEPKTRDGLLRIINRYTGHQVVCVAEDGQSGIAAVKEHHPDLVLTDIMMPGMNGLEMLEQLSADGEEAQAILLTGYAEFEYARKAVGLGAAGYILKPLEIEEFLTLLETVESGLEKRDLTRVSVSQLIFGVFTSSREEKANLLHVLAERLQMDEKDQATLFLVRPGDMGNEIITEVQYRLEHLLDSLYMGNYSVARLPVGMGILVMLMDTGHNHSIRSVFQQKILPGLAQFSPCSCSCSTIHRAEELEREVLAMHQLLHYTMAFASGVIIDKEMVGSLQFQRVDYPDDLENCIRKEIRRGDPDLIRKQGKRFQDRVIESEASPECIREYTAKFASAMLMAMPSWTADAAGAEERFGFHELIQKIIGSQSKPDLLCQFGKVLEIAAASEQDLCQTENTIILKVIAFIRNNYSMDITLTDAADLVGITPEYLSKLFAQEVGENFVVFLRNFRISAAKRLLVTGKLKIHEIAEQVGIRDAKYFNKVFKTVCGVSPTEYKKGGG